MKKILLITILIIVFLLNGCASKDIGEQAVNNSTQEKGQVSKEKFLSNNSQNNCIINEFKLKIPQNADISSFCYHEPYIYYGISYTFYEESLQTVGQKFTYTDDFATQIRRYNVQTQNDILMFRYSEDNKCVEISDIQCNGDTVIWQDHIGQNGEWRVVKLFDDEIELLFSAKDTQSIMDEVTLMEKNGNIYWYDRNEKSKDYDLYQYDTNKKISILEKNISLASPYQHVALDQNEPVKLYVDKNAKVSIQVNGQNVHTGMSKVSDVQVSDGYIVWYEENQTNKVYIYNRSSKEIYEIETGDFFSYGLLDHMLVVNGYAGVVAYDMDKKTYEVVKQSKEKSNIYLYTFRDKDCLYAQRLDDQSVIGIFEIR